MLPTKRTLLSLRSYGDLIINLYCAVRQGSVNAPTSQVISAHLKPLWDALSTHYELPRAQVINIQTDKNILRLFTYKYLLSIKTLNELFALRKELKSVSTPIFLEKADPRNSILSAFTGKQVKPVHQQGTVYDSYLDFYKVEPVPVALPDSVKKLVIFPDSRLQRKEIAPDVLAKISEAARHIDLVQTAVFKNSPSDNPARAHYGNFNELIDIVKSADFIVSSDSLPVHLAQFFHKPHWGIYNGQINREWITPAMKQHQWHSVSTDVQQLEALISSFT